MQSLAVSAFPIGEGVAGGLMSCPIQAPFGTCRSCCLLILAMIVPTNDSSSSSFGAGMDP